MAFVNPADSLAEQRGDAHNMDFRAGGLGNGVRGDDFLNIGLADAFVGDLPENRVRYSGKNTLSPVFMQDLHRSHERACGFRHIIH